MKYKTKLTLSVLAFLVAFLASASAVEAARPGEWEPPSVVVDRLANVRSFLASPSFMVSRSDLRRIDEDPVPELVAIALDERSGQRLRQRAIVSLSLFRDARVKRTLRSLALETDPHAVFEVAALAYMEAFGDAAVLDLEPLLRHRDPAVREVVVHGFGLFGGDAGFYMLLERSRTEADPGVQALLRRFLG